MSIRLMDLFLILLGSLLVYRIAVLLNKEAIKRMYCIAILISVTVYSGIGIADAEVNPMYMLDFFAFILLLILSMSFVYKIEIVNYKDRINRKVNILDKTLNSFEKVYGVVAWIFIASYVAYLIIPKFRLNLLLNPFMGQINLYDVLEQRNISNPILTLVGYIEFFLQPFFLIYLYCLAQKKKYFLLSTMYFLWIYFKFLESFYISRNEIVFDILFFIMILMYTKYKKVHISKKAMLILLLIMALLVPFFMDYQYTRMGLAADVTSYKTALTQLIDSECSYPKYYDLINSINEITPSSYFLYLLFLPIPSAVWPGKPSVIINDVFTYLILGIHRGDARFYIVLPSLLGEAFMIYGGSLFWIHAIVLGIIIGLVYRLLSRADALLFINLYYALLLITIGRGGSQGWVPVALNGLISILIWEAILSSALKEKKIFKNFRNR